MKVSLPFLLLVPGKIFNFRVFLWRRGDGLLLERSPSDLWLQPKSGRCDGCFWLGCDRCLSEDNTDEDDTDCFGDSKCSSFILICICLENARYFSFQYRTLAISLFIILNYFLYILYNLSKQGFTPKHPNMESTQIGPKRFDCQEIEVKNYYLKRKKP